MIFIMIWFHADDDAVNPRCESKNYLGLSKNARCIYSSVWRDGFTWQQNSNINANTMHQLNAQMQSLLSSEHNRRTGNFQRGILESTMSGICDLISHQSFNRKQSQLN